MHVYGTCLSCNCTSAFKFFVKYFVLTNAVSIVTLSSVLIAQCILLHLLFHESNPIRAHSSPYAAKLVGDTNLLHVCPLSKIVVVKTYHGA